MKNKPFDDKNKRSAAKKPERKSNGKPMQKTAPKPERRFVPKLTFAELLEHSGHPFPAKDAKAELIQKQFALSELWHDHALPGKVPQIVPSPRWRNYRTTSKRKAHFSRGQLTFSLGYTLKGGNTGAESLDAELHNIIYAQSLSILNKEHYQVLAKALNFCILRGSYDTAAVVLNVFQLSGTVVRKAKMFAEELTALNEKISGVFLYFDETRSDYYFEAFRPRTQQLDFKKLSGRSLLALALPDRPKLLYPPTVFSQVNESILPQFIDTAMDFAALDGKTRFIDLYCGYGLFALNAAAVARQVVGIDFEGPSIQAARANAAHLFPEQDIRFEAASVTPDALDEQLPMPGTGREVILLDPPRNGTSDGVIAAIAARRPERVIAIYCGIDQMAKEFRLWHANGFELEKSAVFDMFPGSPNLETILLLKQKGKRK